MAFHAAVVEFEEPFLLIAHTDQSIITEGLVLVAGGAVVGREVELEGRRTAGAEVSHRVGRNTGATAVACGCIPYLVPWTGLNGALFTGGVVGTLGA